MNLYAVDDDDGGDGRNASPRDRRAVLRPVRPVTVRDRDPAAAAAPQVSYAPPTYVPGYSQPGYAQPNYTVAGPQGYAPAGYAPTWGRSGPWGWNGQNGPVVVTGMPYAGPWGMWGSSGMGQSIGQGLASSLGSLIEMGTSLVAAFQSLPAAPTADESLDLANVTEYQRRLAEHAKGDERLRSLGSAGGKAIDLIARLFSNPSSGPGPFMAPRGWY